MLWALGWGVFGCALMRARAGTAGPPCVRHLVEVTFRASRRSFPRRLTCCNATRELFDVNMLTEMITTTVMMMMMMMMMMKMMMMMMMMMMIMMMVMMVMMMMMMMMMNCYLSFCFSCARAAT